MIQLGTDMITLKHYQVKRVEVRHKHRRANHGWIDLAKKVHELNERVQDIRREQLSQRVSSTSHFDREADASLCFLGT